MATDKYMYFTFNGIHSSEYNCFFENVGDLNLPLFPEFSDTKSTPLFQDHTYYLGTTIKDKKFTFNCFVEKVNRRIFKQITTWLSIKQVGELKLDFVRNYHWNVKINSIGQVRIYPLGDSDYAHYEFQITFETVNDAAAVSDRTYTFDEANPRSGVWYDVDYRLPLWDKYNRNGNISTRMFNYQTYEYFPTISTSASTLKYRYKGTDEWYYYTNLQNSTLLNGRYGYAVDSNGELVERSNSNSSNSNKGPIPIEPSNIFQVEGSLVEILTQGQGIEFIFDIDSTVRDKFDNGWSSWTPASRNENKLNKGIIVTNNNIFNYNLYNQEGYSEGLYYVAFQDNIISYVYGIYESQLHIILYTSDTYQSVSDEGYNALNKIIDGITYENVWTTKPSNNKYTLTIGEYTELTNSVSSDNTITFNLRTLI